MGTLQVWPRFPVLGGWNFDLRVRYNQPVSSLLLQQEAGSSSSSVSLKIPLEPIFSDIYAEQLSLTVALPTGAPVAALWHFEVLRQRAAAK